MAAKVPNWFWVLLPANAAINGFGTMGPLYILSLGGNVLQASILTGLMNLVIVPSVVLWGAVTDRITGLRVLFVVAYIGTAIVFLLMLSAPAIAWITVLTGCLGFVWVANTPAQNLLIMETNEKKNWFAMFATASFIANLGAIMGLLVGLVWTYVLPLRYFFLFCAAASALSAVLSSRLVVSAPMVLETKSIIYAPWYAWTKVQTTASLVARMAVLIPSKLFSRASLSTAYKAMVMSSFGGIRRLFISSFLFNFAANFYGASYVPFLSVSSVASSLIFGITVTNVAVQTFTYRYADTVKGWLGGESRTGLVSTTIMWGGYVAIATSTFLVHSGLLFPVNLADNLVMGFGLAAWNAFNAGTVYSSLRPESQGGAIGLFSALNSFGVVLGAFLSGIASLYIGYSFTFAVASILMVVSIVVRRSPPKSG